MRKLMNFLLLCSLIYPAASFGGADTWEPVVTDGFGNRNNQVVIEFAVFKDTLYATTSTVPPDTASLYRSASGDSGTWERVVFDPDSDMYGGIPSMNTTTLGGGYMWMAASNPPDKGAVVYQTRNGTDWTQINQKGFTNLGNFVPAPNMVVFRATEDDPYYLYGAGSSHGEGSAATVYRTPFANTDTTNWETVIDFNVEDPTATQVTYFYVWNEKLYFGSNGQIKLFESKDGMTFKENTGFADAIWPSDQLIACINEYGGYLWASTLNKMRGGQLYRTLDGVTWERRTSTLEDPRVWAEELHHMDVGNGYLWITAYTNTEFSTGCPVWRSADGTGDAFVQSNDDGFGNPDIDGENPITIGFKGSQYFGGPNFVAGAQIWRTRVTPPVTPTTPDFTGDGLVNFSDFVEFVPAYNTVDGDATYSAKYDLTGDGKVDFSDFLDFASAYGRPVSGGG